MTVGYIATFRGKESVNRNKRVINIHLAIKEEILACSFANLHCQKAHRHAMSKDGQLILQQQIASVFHSSLLVLAINFVITLSK